jgi:hypothetical protein
MIKTLAESLANEVDVAGAGAESTGVAVIAVELDAAGLDVLDALTGGAAFALDVWSTSDQGIFLTSPVSKRSVT